ncbi:CDP-glucose 4,6-dehydratase [Clostridium sp. CM028]|uniref:CDP-glucose 4,6-dehydratase n=1 Tax=Clostridium sp. CM028 TaxID=2851575 RepID=UPI001C6E8082|nr:CDP-glucose 4,6-dehydratase [Clostridium sp. CM028]MBW9147780.1 CDP-glucose 4,6-dehydratase [Clostridium sp. CM028]WLC61225.1 CDP-glucose 4,6-dehydratase [Clostridium sp. CM028]
MLKDLENNYKNKNVLITGHTGFKGSWLAIWLKKLGANVIGYALDPVSVKSNFVLSEISNDIVDIRGDIRDSKHLNEVFMTYEPEIVFHLAAQPLVRYSYENPKETYEVNFMGTVNVLEAVRASKETKALVIITSDKCYENSEWMYSYREIDPMGGYDPYSSSKGCVELLVSSYRNSFFNTAEYKNHEKIIVTARAGNVIGGGDWAIDRIIPDCIRALENDEEILLRNPGAVRPWQHVLEPLYGYLLLGTKILKKDVEFSGAWNFGPEAQNVITVQEVVRRLVKEWGNGSWKSLILKGDSFHEASLLSLDISKARFCLNFKPRWGIDETIEKTVEWYRQYKDEKVIDICESQISDYCR